MSLITLSIFCVALKNRFEIIVNISLKISDDVYLKH